MEVNKNFITILEWKFVYMSACLFAFEVALPRQRLQDFMQSENMQISAATDLWDSSGDTGGLCGYVDVLF